MTTTPSLFLPNRARARTPRGHFLTFAIAAFAGVSASHAQVLWSSAGGSAWLTGTNWTGSAVPTAGQVAQFGTNPTAATGVGINFNSTTNAGTQVNGQRVQEAAAIQVTSARAAAFIVGNSSGTSGATGTLRLLGATIGANSNVILQNDSSQSFTIQNIQGSGNQTMALQLTNTTANNVAITGSGNVAISSVINEIGGARKLGVLGTGTGDLILTGANTFTGGIDISGAGKLRFGASTSLPTTGNMSISGDGRLRFSTAGTFGSSGQTVTINPTATTNPAIDLQTSNIAVTMNQNIAINAAARIEANGPSGSLTLAGNLSGSGQLLKQAAGNLILSGTSNTATGGTQIGNGTVTVNSGSSLGTGALTMFQTATNNTALTLNNSAQTIGGLTSQFTAVSGTQTQTVTLNGTALTVNQTTDGTYGVGAVSTLTSTITGTGALAKNGSAKLTLTGSNTYTGTTTVSAGTLEAAANNALGSTTGVTVNSGGTLLLSNTGTTNRINDSATVTLGGGTIAFFGNVTEGSSPGTGALTLAANSIIDFASGNAVLNFGASQLATWAVGTTLSIYNWAGLTTGGGADQLLFGSDSSSLTSAQLDQISFFSGAGTGFLGTGTFVGSLGEVVPVPEPTGTLAALALFGIAGWRERRREQVARRAHRHSGLATLRA